MKSDPERARATIRAAFRRAHGWGKDVARLLGMTEQNYRRIVNLLGMRGELRAMRMAPHATLRMVGMVLIADENEKSFEKTGRQTRAQRRHVLATRELLANNVHEARAERWREMAAARTRRPASSGPVQPPVDLFDND